MSAVLLTVADIVKYFGPEPVLDGASFDLREGERVSLVGPNGAGKTTLLRILMREVEPDSGRLELATGSSIGFLQQHPEFEPNVTVWSEARSALEHLLEIAHEAEELGHAIATAADDAERARLGKRFDLLQHELQTRDVYQIDRKIEQVLTGLGFAEAVWQKPVSQLSGGQQNRLLLAKLLLEDPDIMLLDEPSNHLDIDATQWLEDFLINCRRAVLVVSHDRYFLDRVTQRTLELYHGTVDSYPGNFSKYKVLKAERLEVQRRTYDKQRIEIAKTEDFIRRNFAGQKSAQAEDRRKKLERIERVELPREIVVPAMSFPPASRTGDIVLRVEKLSKSFDRPLFRDLNFDVLRGEKWGILGPNGTGKTTLLRCIVGQLAADAGKASFGAGVKFGYFDQMLSQFSPDTEVLDAVRPDHKEFVQQQRRDLLARFGVTGDMVFQKVGSLSGGERNRVALAWLSALDANVLILDEPTNHLDLWARDALEAALRAFDGTLIFVSHDRYFLNQVADKLLVVEPDRFRVIDGNYDTYMHLLQGGLAKEARGLGAGSAATTARSVAPGAAATEPRKAERRKRKYAYRKAEEIEAEIAQREARIEELHDLLGSADVLRDGAKMKTLTQELSDQHTKLPELYEHWEEATELNG
jgi:ATP-binding cassette subfamily F protein 3